MIVTHCSLVHRPRSCSAARRFQRETSGDAKTLERHGGFLQRNVFASRFNISRKNCIPGDADPPTKQQHPWATLEHLDTRLLHPSRARRGGCRPPSIHLRCEASLHLTESCGSVLSLLDSEADTRATDRCSGAALWSSPPSPLIRLFRRSGLGVALKIRLPTQQR